VPDARTTGRGKSRFPFDLARSSVQLIVRNLPPALSGFESAATAPIDMMRHRTPPVRRCESSGNSLGLKSGPLS
jgi:hypothetical protein